MSDSGDEKDSALFATLILQQSNMALLMMGKVPDPSTGKTHVDLEKASLFIDMLAMLEARTRGNCSSNEERLLKETLAQLRMTYVESTKAPAQPAPKSSPQATDSPAAAEPKPDPSTSAATPPEGSSPSEETIPETPKETKKKFTKKY